MLPGLLLSLLLGSGQAVAGRLVVHDYFPGYWNNSSYVKRNNNCYNYATNRKTNNYAQPGWASGYRGFSLNRKTCAAVKMGAIKDRNIYEVRPGYNPDSSYNRSYRTLQALVIEPGRDYHWYRRDKNGRWSHKVGWSPATNRDNAGRIIVNPEIADRGGYRIFCGYFHSSSSAMRGGGRRSNGYQGGGHAMVSGTFKYGAQGGLKDFLNVTPEINDQKSTVTILAYSGRQNPTIALSELNNYTQLKLSDSASLLSSNLISPLTVEKDESFIASYLGYSGVLIEDHEGLYFDKGTRVLIKGGIVKILASPEGLKRPGIKMGVDAVNDLLPENTMVKTNMLDVSIEEDILTMARNSGHDL